MNNALEQKNQVIQQQRDTVSAQINSSFDALVANPNKTRLPEQVFISYFLPFFAGELNHPFLANRNVITDWISVAGSAMSEVDIIDYSGAVIYTTPSLFNTNVIEIVNRKPGNSLSDVYSEYELRSSIPSAASNFLNQALFNKGADITQNVDNLKTSKVRWEQILIRYGKINAVAGNDKTIGVDPADDVIYD